MGSSGDGVEDRIEAVRAGIEGWRRIRAKGSPMPAELWDAATALAQREGVAQIARALRIDPGSLKARLEAARGRGGPVAPAGFAAVDLSLCVGEAAGSVIELSRADGAKLVVRLAGSVDVVALAGAFLRCGA
jgi:hypothetical protein